MTSDQLSQIVHDFQSKDTITITEFRAWVAGFVSRDVDQIMAAQLNDVLTMVLKVVPDSPLTIPQTPVIPTWPIPRQTEPFNTPRTPDPQWPTSPPDIWCDATHVGGETNNTKHQSTNTHGS